MSTARDRRTRTAHALVFVIPGFAFSRLGFSHNHNYRFTRSFSSASPGALLLPDDPPPGEIHQFAFGVWNDPDRYPAAREGELLRRQLAPQSIPRLGGVFFFASLDSCRRAARQWPTAWDLATVRAGTAHGRIERHDMMLSTALLSPDSSPTRTPGNGSGAITGGVCQPSATRIYRRWPAAPHLYGSSCSTAECISRKTTEVPSTPNGSRGTARARSTGRVLAVRR